MVQATAYPARVVLDASVALAWLLPDEQSAKAEAIIEAGSLGQLAAPSLILLEVSNALTQAKRRSRIDTALVKALLDQFGSLPLRLEPVSSDVMLRSSTLAMQHDISVYDASYLDLATVRALPLATFDARLHDAAVSAGVNVV
jgi:predicted nucleic acid-binding protein